MSGTLKERVEQFNSLSLPGQPMTMHMGTSYLVNDLWREVQRLQHSARKAKSVFNAARTYGDLRTAEKYIDAALEDE